MASANGAARISLAVLGRMAKLPAQLALPWLGEIFSYLYSLEAYIHVGRESSSFEGQFGEIILPCCKAGCLLEDFHL